MVSFDIKKSQNWKTLSDLKIKNFLIKINEIFSSDLKLKISQFKWSHVKIDVLDHTEYYFGIVEQFFFPKKSIFLRKVPV